MTEQQLANVMGAIVAHQRSLLELTNEEGAWVAQNTKEAMELFKKAVRERIQEEKKLKDFFCSSGQVAQASASGSRTNLLELVSTVTIPATTASFVAKDHFKLKKDGGICSYLGGNLQALFGEKVEDPISEQTLRYHKLRKSSVDGPIITELGGEEKSETTLTEMFSLMEKQKNGEDGVLLNNGWANIFYVRDNAGVLRAVRVRWYVGGWLVSANSVERPRGWGGGDRVFSHLPDEASAKAGNSVLESSEPVSAAS